ncbi:MAG: 2-amino-4-hydroxy-6-hydroxymethyldihydropteridine diphosphokinase [Gammaproteobacteria bacterium]|nr:2-amino-4-hydroxy-6-hydroxymethyldihydropteridine diphosphokinase [Gammaproteobacteria bacterium]
MQEIYVSIGSNMEPVKNISRCREILQKDFGCVTFSPAYQSKAVGFRGKPFLNLAAAIHTHLPFPALTLHLKRIEQQMGRTREQKGMSDRIIDIDILIYDGRIIDPEETLTQAHLLKPLTDLAPEIKIAETGPSLAECWHQLDRQGTELEKFPGSH